MVVGFSGCEGGCESLTGHGQTFQNFDGAQLVVPATATAGETIVLDARGSAVVGGEGTRAQSCPKMLRFYRRLPSGEFEQLGKYLVQENDASSGVCRVSGLTSLFKFKVPAAPT